MRRIVLFLAVVCAFSMLALPALAQQTTSTPMPVGQVSAPAATTTPGVNEANTIRFRIADFVPDGPTFVVYVNNAPSAIPNLTFPSMTGWLELPGSSAQLSFIPQGAAKSLALASPVTVSPGNWTTIALVGSVAANSVSAVQINADVGAIPQGCARVTVFNAVEGGQNFDLMNDNTSIASGLAFPGAMAQPNTTGATSTQQVGANTTVMSTAEATSMAGSAASCANSTGAASNSANMMTMTGGTTCTAVSPASGTTGTGAISTEQAGAATTGTQEAGANTTGSQMASGQMFNNCAFTFDVPAGTINLSANSSGSTTPLASMANMSFAADTYYFVALIGTPSSPRVFTFSFPASSISGMMTSGNNG